MAIFSGKLLTGQRPTVFGVNLLAANAEVTGPVNVGWARETSLLEFLQLLGDLGDFGRLGDPVLLRSVPARPAQLPRRRGSSPPAGLGADP